MDEITEVEIGAAITGLMRSIDAEYAEMTESEVRSKFYFTFDPERSPETNLYLFFDRLALFGGSCRRWEEMHNGRSCMVERVRDKYLMPKIREFAGQLGL